MKTAVLPPVEIESELLDALGSVLTDGETVASFVEAAVRASVEWRLRARTEFVARARRSRDEERRTGSYVDADVVIESLQHKLDAAHARIAGSPT